jgi:N-acetylmuramoyl-L-alanine amidase
MMKPKQLGPLLIALLLSLSQALPVQAKTRLKNMRHWTAPDHTRLVFDLNAPPKYRLSPEGDSRHIIVELADTRSLLRYKQRKIVDGLINTVRIKPKDKKTLGIIIDLMLPGKADVFSLKKFRDKPDRLVIDVIRPLKKAIRQRKIKSASQARQKGQRIVLIDPGHGGEDPGAVGRRLRLKEKRVVLKIAQRLHYLLKREPGITPYLTRSSDY